jgi:hypothetical protein
MEQKFNVGDKVKILNKDKWMYKSEILKVVDSDNDTMLNHINLMYVNLHAEDFKLVEEKQEVKKQFSVDDLCTGMRVKYRNGKIGIVLKDIGAIGTECGYNSIEFYGRNDAYDIVEVYDGFRHSGYVLNFNKLGNLIWQLEEKTEQQKQIEALEETIKQAQRQIAELKAKQ